MTKAFFILLVLAALAGCAFRERPNRTYVNETPPPVKNQVETIQQAAEVLISDLLARSQCPAQITVALLPVENRYLESGVSNAILNGIQDELFARNVFKVQKDYDLKSVRQILAVNEGLRGFLDNSTAQQIARYTRADAIITCQIEDAVQFWQIHVAIIPVNSNFVQASATCYLDKRKVINSQKFR